LQSLLIVINELYSYNREVDKTSFKIDFIGIGAEKAASSWVADCLWEHPEVDFPFTKELAFFNEYDHHLLKVKNPRYFRGIKWYEKQFNHSDKSKILGEYTPTYLYSKETAKRIKKHFPDVKIIVSLRDPVARMFSQYIHDQRLGIIRMKVSFEEALEKIDSYYIKSNYAKYLAYYFNIFGREKVMVVFLDDIKKDNAKVAKDLYKFVGLNDINFKPKVLEIRDNAASEPKSWLANYLMTQTEYFLMRNKLYKLHYLIEDLNLRKLACYISYDQNRVVIKKEKRRKIEPETEKRLRKKMRKSVIKLEELINRDLTMWK
jgi:hypothetical protein